MRYSQGSFSRFSQCFFLDVGNTVYSTNDSLLIHLPCHFSKKNVIFFRKRPAYWAVPSSESIFSSRNASVITSSCHFMSCCHVITSSCHHVVMLSCHYLIWSSCHHVVMSSYGHIIMSSCHYVIMMLCCHVVILSCHHIVVWSCPYTIMSSCCNVFLS